MTCSSRSPSFTVDVLEILGKLQSAGFCLDLDASFAHGAAETRPDRMAVLFELILRLLFKEISPKEKEDVRSFPAMLGDGRPVDLLRLYGSVEEKGGYRSVTAAGSWGSVADDAGLDSGVGSALKLIYAKYLRVLDRWLRRVSARRTGGTIEHNEEAGPFSAKADEDDFGPSSRGVLDQKAAGGEGTPLISNEKLRATLKGCKLKEQLANGGGDHEVMVLESVTGGAQSPCRRRKRDSLVGLLDWLRKVAKSPGNILTGNMQLDQSKSKCHAIEEPFSQALFAREAMFAKLFHSSGTDANLSQKRQKVDPSMYDECSDTDLISGKLRCSERIISLKKKLQSASCSEASTVPECDSDKDLIESGLEGIDYKQHSRDCSSSYVAGLFTKDRKCARIGPEHQANIPEWTGGDSATSNDTNNDKFLGTPMWPLERREQKPFFKQDPIGRGRHNTCGCEHSGSVECVRFHVAEKRFHLKRELGSAFYGMGLDRMGEEVSLSWMKEEEEKFKTTVCQNPPSLSKSFWDPVFLCFPSKTRQSLVSYYFNVFILQRRSYQNRVTPKQIDSDDDESEFGFLSNAFGRNAVEFRNPKSIICVQNAQCVNLDDSTDT